MSQDKIALLEKQVATKTQLNLDLHENMKTLRKHRRDELVHFQSELESMRTRCRDWYEKLMGRVREMESAYHDKINAELTAKHQQMSEQFMAKERALKEQLERERSLKESMVNDDELRREIARLNEDLEKFKGKYFDGEQKKIELGDQLDEVKEERYKMEEKMESLKVENETLQRELDEKERKWLDRDLEDKRDTNRDPYSAGGGHNRRSTEEWNTLVQKLREEKETQETQYEVEFREFEQMANQKVVCSLYCVRTLSVWLYYVWSRREALAAGSTGGVLCAAAADEGAAASEPICPDATAPDAADYGGAASGGGHGQQCARCFGETGIL